MDLLAFPDEHFVRSGPVVYVNLKLVVLYIFNSECAFSGHSLAAALSDNIILFHRWLFAGL